MKQFLTLIYVCMVCNGQAQTPAAVPTPDPSSAAIDALRAGLVASFTKGDIEGLVQHLDPDVLVTWQNAEICRGHNEVRAFYNKMMTGENRIVKKIDSAPEVTGRRVQGDWAVSWGNLRDHFVLTDGSDLPFNSVFTATLRKDGDRWVVAAFHTSVNAFENPVIPLILKKTSLWIGIGSGIVGLILGVVLGRRRKV